MLRANSFLNGCNLPGCVFVNTRCLRAACLAQLSHREGTSAGKHLAASRSQVGQPWEEPGARKSHGAGSSSRCKAAPGSWHGAALFQRPESSCPTASRAQSQPHLGVPASCGCPCGPGVTAEQCQSDSRGTMAPCRLCGMLGLPVPAG